MGGHGLDKKDNVERREGLIPSADRDSRIQVFVNQPQDDGALEIDLVRVFRNMKRKFRIYAWVILLCFAVGLCVPLLMFQFSKAPLTVSSVVTLDYTVVKRDSAGEIVSSARVKNLTAPDGSALDLSRIAASNVLQAAMDGLELSQPITLTALRDNIRIERILTEDSRRQQEIAAKMMSDKNNALYSQIQNIELTYENQFVVSLTNGFGSAGVMLTDAELRLVLDRVLAAYNDDLVTTYADIRMPDDEFDAIDVGKQDILESLDLLRSAVQDLYDFCAGQTASVRRYRSWKTGVTLNDLMKALQTARSVNVDYLYSYVSTNSIVRDRDSVITNYQYQMRRAQTSLDALYENVATVQEILDSYKNDQIIVSMQDSETVRATSATTDYYNRLFTEQANNYDKIARLEERIADLQYQLDNLYAAEAAETAAAQQQEIVAELNEALGVCRKIYGQVCDQMEEIHASSFFTNYAEHSVPQGKTASFLSAAAKKTVIGGVAGAVVACGLWFLSAFALEFRSNEKGDGKGKEAAKG